MHKVKTRTAHGYINEFKANKTSNTAPVVIEEVFDNSDSDNPVRMYLCEPKEPGGEPRMVLADTYDRLWSSPKSLSFDKNYKGTNPNGTLIK